MKSKVVVLLVIFLLILNPFYAWGNVKCVLLYGPSSFPIGKLSSAEIVRVPQQALALLLKGEADVIAFPVNAAIKLRLKGKDVKLLGVYIWKTFYLLSSDPHVRDLYGVEGEVYFPHFKGTMADLMGRVIFSNRITYKYAPPMAIVSFLKERKARFGVLPEPMASIAELSGAKVIYDLQERWGTVPITGLITTEKILNRERKEILFFLKDFSEAVSWTCENPTRSAEAFCKRLGFKPLEAIRKAIKRSHLKFIYGKDLKNVVISFFREVSPSLSKVDEGFFGP